MARGTQPRKRSDTVFINCPFSPDFRPVLDAIIFAICDCGFAPRCALEIADGGEVRLDKIYRLIEECRFGIHDISYVTLDPDSKLPRFNMAFEVGLFLGAKRFGRMKKSCLILDTHKYRYLTCISDLRGHDIAYRGKKPIDVVAPVRDWLSHHSGRSLPGPADIRKRYREFLKQKPALCSGLRLKVKELGYREYLNLVYVWLREP